MLGAAPHGYASKNGSDPIADISGTNMVRDASLNSLEEDILVFPLLQDADEFAEHCHYVALDAHVGPVCVTVKTEGCQANLLVWSGLGAEELDVSLSITSSPTWYDQILKKNKPSINEILQHVEHPLAQVRFSKVRNPSFGSCLARMEERLVLRRFKFGLLWARADQSNFNDILRNNYQDTLDQFWSFATFLGRYILLRGWRNYSGGLDTVQDLCGTTSYYTEWQQMEFMFHVGPLIASNPKDPQQIERKRFIGNDQVIILFREFAHHKPPFELGTVCSRQVHAVVVVDPVSATLEDGFQFTIYRRSIMSPIKHLRGANAILSLNSPLHRDLFLASCNANHGH